MNQAALESAHLGMTDAEVARRIASGDRSALQLLMRRHNQKLYRTARSILKDETEAEDAVQEAYLSAYRAMGSFRSDAKLSTWLVRIVANEALARLRKRKRSAEIIRLDGDTQSAGQSSEVNMSQASPEQPDHAASRAEARRMLERKIDELPDAFRATFVLRAIEELSVEETAVVLDIPEATVRSRLFRARGMLRESLAREIDFAFEDAFAFAGGRCDRIVACVLARLDESRTADD